MFVKIFSKIFDSSIAENWKARVTFMDLLVLADRDGVVDMTLEAIARRTNTPIEFLREGLDILAAPDPQSRNADDDGRRIELLDEHRDWGWKIINYTHYRDLRSSDQMRESNRVRVARHRAKKKGVMLPVTLSNGEKRLSPHADAEAEAKVPPNPLSGELVLDIPHPPRKTSMMLRFDRLYRRKEDRPWTKEELKFYKAIGEIPEEEMIAVEKHYSAMAKTPDKDFRKRELQRCLRHWSGVVDAARQYKPANCF